MSKVVNLISSNFGKIRPDSISDYVNAGGFQGLRKALTLQPTDIIEEVKKSKLMGRGGAAYPTGVKFEQAFNIKKFPKYIICNADEGEPGTFKDRLLLSNDPLRVIEGMIIAAYILNAYKGYIYIRGEYTNYQKIVKAAIKNAIDAGYLGDNILGTNFSFNIEVISGAGAYVCGENSALIESCEGKAGRPRIKPPFVKNSGIFNMPTLLNNVETFACLSYIIKNGGEKYSSFGTEYSGGTKLVSLSGNVVNRGVFEVPFGITLREIIYDIGGGIRNGRKLKLVQIGGSSGPCFSEELLDTPLCYKELKNAGLALGSGAILVIDDSNCVVDFVKCVMEFFIHESCGKCTPCREGNRHLYKIVSKFVNGTATYSDFERIETLASTMKMSSFCGLGQTSATALLTSIKYFRNEFEDHINNNCRAGICTFGKEDE